MPLLFTVEALNINLIDIDLFVLRFGHTTSRSKRFLFWIKLSFALFLKGLANNHDKGNTYPEIHLVMYVRKMSAYVGNDELFIHCFQDSLTDAALIWYMGLNKADIKTFKDLSEAFVQRYNYKLHLAPDRKELQAMTTQNDNESFKAYAQRWRDVAAQVRPSLEEKELTEIFLETLDQFYYEHMLASASGNFAEMMTVGMRIEEWV